MAGGVILDFTGKPFRCMLAYQETPVTVEDIAKLAFPMLMSPKLDGIRMSNVAGNMLSRSSKVFPSAFVHTAFGGASLSWVDGEGIYGKPNRHDVFSDTYSAMMTHGANVPIQWYVFDYFGPGTWHLPYNQRLDFLLRVAESAGNPNVIVLPQKLVHTWSEVLAEEARLLDEGYEGAIIRSPNASYKFGRSTLRENGLVKIKRFETREATIVGFYELEHNDNEAFTDERGFTKRTTHKEGKRASGLLGGFQVKDLESGVHFNVGSGIGMDMALRKHAWENQHLYLGRIISYKKLVVGEKEKPRNCTFRGFRDPIDMG